MGLFRKKKAERPDLRAMWLTSGPPAEFLEAPVAMVLVDIGLDEGHATIMSAPDGATSMYTSTSGGVIGAGEHPGPAAASKDLVRLCGEAVHRMKPVKACPPPGPGQWAFNVRTPGGWHRFTVDEDRLQDERHPAHPLFLAAHAVLGEIRMVSGS